MVNSLHCAHLRKLFSKCTITMTQATVELYKETLKKKAEELLKTQFPKKIVDLNNILDQMNFNGRSLPDVHQEVNIPVPESDPNDRSKRRRTDAVMATSYTLDGPKVYTLPNGPVPSNKLLCKLIHLAKPYMTQLVEDSNILKMWISYLIPKIEDSNNFGVSIQGRTLNEIQLVEAKGEELLDNFAEYFLSRAKIVSKVAKYPHIDDYRRAVKELDEKEYLSLWLALCEVRNRYCVLHDLVTKNFDKIKKPRSVNTDTLY